VASEDCVESLYSWVRSPNRSSQGCYGEIRLILLGKSGPAIAQSRTWYRQAALNSRRLGLVT